MDNKRYIVIIKDLFDKKETLYDKINCGSKVFYKTTRKLHNQDKN